MTLASEIHRKATQVGQDHPGPDFVFPENFQAPPELGAEYFQRPNFRVGDGVHARYGLEGDLRWIVSCQGGALNGLCLRFEPEGFVRPQDSGIFKEGKLIERYQESLLPDDFLSRVLGEMVVPMKKALKIGLSPCEARLCYENYVDVDSIQPMDLNTFPAGGGPETVEELGGGGGASEWWRPQVQLVDPSKVYDGLEKPDHFAPIGPSRSATEVTPFRQFSSPGRFKEQICDADDDLKEIFMLGKLGEKVLLHDRVAQLAEERRLRGYELGDATVMNSSILLAGQRELYYLKSFGTDEASDLTGLGLPSAVGGGTEVPRGLAFWPQQNLLFLAPPRGGIVASRMADLNHSLGIDFRLPMQEAVFGLSVDQDEDLLYVLLQQELRVFDLGDRPGSLLRSFRLPQEENNTWSGLACVGRRLFAVMHSPAKLLHLQLPGRQCSLRNCQEMMS
eukprot:s50_g16.t1